MKILFFLFSNFFHFSLAFLFNIYKIYERVRNPHVRPKGPFLWENIDTPGSVEE